MKVINFPKKSKLENTTDDYIHTSIVFMSRDRFVAFLDSMSNLKRENIGLKLEVNFLRKLIYWGIFSLIVYYIFFS